MNHRFIRSVKTRGRFAGFLPPFFLLGAIALFHFFYPAVLQDIAERVATPFLKGERFLADTTRDASLFFSSKFSLIREVEDMRAELKRAESLLADRELLRLENRLLKEQFGRATEENARRLGMVLALPSRSPYDTTLIDIGSRDGVRVGDLALSGSIVLGVVEKTSARASLVEFFSTAGRRTSVLILHEGKALPAEAEGWGGGEFRIVLPRETDLSLGDQIILPESGLFLFASVETIEGRPTDSFQTVRFRSPVSMYTLRALEILPPAAKIELDVGI